jgi:crotonobetainyl-CoA:carnitine CoA-transferase CaiB-like acyl-CoA transferase
LLAELDLLGHEAEGLPRLSRHGTSVIALVSNRSDGAGYEALGHGALGLLEPPRLEESGEVVGGARTLAVIHRLGVLVRDSQAAHAPPAPPVAARDGRHIVLAGQEPKFIRNLLTALKREDLIPLCLRGPGPHQQPVIDFLAETFGKMSSGEAQAFLSGLDVCYGALNTLPEAFEDPNITARGSILRDDLGRRHIAPVIRFLNEPAEPSLHAPALGLALLTWNRYDFGLGWVGMRHGVLLRDRRLRS